MLTHILKQKIVDLINKKNVRKHLVVYIGKYIEEK